MKKVILTLTMVAFAVALQAGENCAKACADKAKVTAKAATCDKAKASAAACSAKQARKADATAKGATQLAKR